MAFVGSRRALLYGRPSWVLRNASVDVDFANSRYYGGSLSSLLSTSRASTGYAQTSAGLLVPFAANVPRITDLGLLVEEARTNNILWSQDFTNVAWQKLNGGTGSAPIVTGNFAAAPDGTLTASRIQFALGATPSSATSRIFQSPSLAVAATNSLYLKTNDGTTKSLYIVGATANTGILISVTGTWQKFSSVASGPSFSQIQFGLSGATGAGGITTDTSADILAWGADVETAGASATSFPTSYIPTTTTSAARAADNITAAGALNTVLGNNVAGSILVIGGGTLNSTGVLIGKDGANQSNILRVSSASAVQLRASGTFFSANLGTGSTAGLTKVGASFDSSPSNSVVANNGTVVNGNTLFTSSGAAPFIGSFSGSYYGGYIQRLSVWNSRLPDATLKGLTQ